MERPNMGMRQKCRDGLTVSLCGWSGSFRLDFTQAEAGILVKILDVVRVF